MSPRRQAWAARNIDPSSSRLLARDEAAFLHQSVSTPCLNTIKGAEGAYIIDGQGRRYLDFHGNNVHHIGYGHPKLKEAITRQMEELPFAPRRFTCEPAVELAEKLRDISPGDLGKVLFATGGSDAIEMALKVARAKTGRFKTLSFWDAFHGAGFGASSIGGEQLFRGQAIGPLLPGTEHVAPFACYRCPYGYEARPDGTPDLETCKMTCANMVRYVLEKEGNVAAVIAEPARAVPYMPPPGFWKAVRQACNEAGAVLIFDEIPTGLGKTGKMFACDHDEVVPDILVMGKALGGGILPIAATLCHPDLDVLGEYAIGHYTHEKNPVTTRAALTTIEIIEEEGLVENAASVGAYALARMQDMKSRHDLIGDVRGRGFLLGLELVEDRKTRAGAPDAAEEILYKALDAGLSFKTTMGNVLTLTPPLITTREQMDFALDILEAAIAAY
ncbi:aspartate aminotransferase family protein [Sneathiella chinensis]|uniref:Aspartate aminotransferase family protein n=1 Tax=Sneathiella chinensis TaxID=349750 RepID=A0ABQ5U5T0_9PROT|nr:aspartate aminotransferase family protein [Sneathiella chinensis]